MELTDDLRAKLEEAFDPAFYLARNPDVAETLVDPLKHFLAAGWREGRDPNRDFSLASYLEMNPDVAIAGVNPFLHWLAVGQAEGREIKSDLGFRYEILRNQADLESHVETNRGHHRPGGPREALWRDLEDLGSHLYVTIGHDEYVGRTGGVQTVIRREAAEATARGWSHLHLYPAIPMPVLDFESLDPVFGLVVGEELRGLYRAADLAWALTRRRRSGRVAGVRFAIHSLLGHSASAVIEVLRALGAGRGWVWAHDQSSLCANYLLLRNDVEFCGAPPPDSPACGICIYGQRRRIQLADHAALFAAFEIEVLTPSRAMLDHWLASAPYPHGPARTQTLASLRSTGEAARIEAEAPFRIGFLGFPVAHKGWPLFEALANAFAGDGRYEFVHLGAEPAEESPCRFVEVDSGSTGGEAMIRAVEAEALDLAFIASLCPETFCFTAREAVAGGAALAALDSSLAVADFIRSGEAPGVVLRHEGELHQMLESGAVLALSRGRRRPVLATLELGAMAAEFLPDVRNTKDTAA